MLLSRYGVSRSKDAMPGSEFGEDLAPAAVHDQDCIHYQALALGQLRETIGHLFEQDFASIVGSESHHREHEHQESYHREQEQESHRRKNHRQESHHRRQGNLLKQQERLLIKFIKSSYNNIFII